MSSQHVRVNLSSVALRLAGLTSLWRPLVTYDAASRYYVRLAAEPDFEAWLLTWLPGQGTEWHDHGGSAGAFVPVLGTLTEQVATTTPGQPPRVVPTARRLGAGALRPFGTKHIHRVSNHDLEPAVSVHVYAPALVEMNSYEERGQLLALVASQREGVSW